MVQYRGDNKESVKNLCICSMKKKPSKNLVWAIITFLLAILTIKVVLDFSKNISICDLVDSVASSDKLFLGLAVLASAMYIVFEAFAVCNILKKAGYKRSIKRGLLYSNADFYYSAITPSATGGQPASALYMHRDGIPAGIITATLILNMMMYTMSIIFIGVVSIIISPRVFLDFNTFSKVIVGLGFAALTTLAIIFYIMIKNERIIFKPLSGLITFLYNKKIIKEKERKLNKINKISGDYRMCAELITGHRSLLVSTFIWNVLQRGSQIMVPMLVYASLGGEKGRMITVFAKQCMVNIGYNLVPIPGAMGISDYLMIDGFGYIMSENMVYTVEMISRAITFYFCVTVSGIVTLLGYFAGRKKS